MYKVKILNDISDVGLNRFTNKYQVSKDFDDEDAILLRSANIHEYEFNENVKAVARAGAGVNNIPIDKCSEKGIVVFNTPGANANAVKELVFAGLLLGSRGIYEGMKWVQTQKDNENVAKDTEKQKKLYSGNELMHKNLGIIGLGAIGVQVANLAIDFGMNVYGYDPFISLSNAWNLSRNVHHSDTIDEILKNCDFISLHIPLNDKTKHILNADIISRMKPNVKILNFSRDGLVDTDALIEGLESGIISKYITDFPVQKLIGNDKVLIFPHLGASTEESEDNCALLAVKQTMDYLERGNITNSVNLPDCHMDINGNVRICCIHKNVPKMLTQISDSLSQSNVNIENLINKSKNELAYTMVDIANVVDDTILNRIKQIPGMIRVTTYNFDKK
ncbi:MAG: phosphoglycerate dehydrogenase [Erysipelotrichaceae bacterium]|jgi:D-3-phosphoglycerate dehydrogenase|nr:phosphoglycerate dehydrogenase [Bacillota bacterium]NLP21698.1 phosphoglycerate dehydrogenase [Erysipelotrichaceae bacterium]HCY06799.1 3-phosphoglycerate dehydrogenase [Erysipelotrichaceae bacterium]